MPIFSMRCCLLLAAGAEQDLDEIVGFVAVNDPPARADVLLDKLLASAQTLATAPQRGSIPRDCGPWACASTGRP